MFRGNRQQMPDICGDTVDETQLEMHPLDLHFYLGISQSESATLLAFAKKVSNTLWVFPKSCRYPLTFRRISQYVLP
jgi:hypothetical protein